VDRVGRLERVQAVHPFTIGQRLVPRLGWAAGAVIAERGEGVRANAVEDDVVVLRAFPVEQAELRPCPVDAVGALGVAVHAPVVCGVLLLIDPAVVAPVVHPVDRSVLEHRGVEAAIALPGRIGDEGYFPGLRVVEAQLRPSRERLDQRAIGQQFQPVTDVQHPSASLLRSGRHGQ